MDCSHQISIGNTGKRVISKLQISWSPSNATSTLFSPWSLVKCRGESNKGFQLFLQVLLPLFMEGMYLTAICISDTEQIWRGCFLFCFRPPYIKFLAYPSQSGAGRCPVFFSQHANTGCAQIPLRHQPDQYRLMFTGHVNWTCFVTLAMFLIFMSMQSVSWRNIKIVWFTGTCVTEGIFIFRFLFTKFTYSHVVCSFQHLSLFLAWEGNEEDCHWERMECPSLLILPSIQHLSPLVVDVFSSQLYCTMSFFWLLPAVVTGASVIHSPKVWCLSDWWFTAEMIMGFLNGIFREVLLCCNWAYLCLKYLLVTRRILRSTKYSVQKIPWNIATFLFSSVLPTVVSVAVLWVKWPGKYNCSGLLLAYDLV